MEKQASTLIAHGDYILNKVQDAHNSARRVTDEDLEIYVNDYLSSNTQSYQFLKIEGKENEFNIQLPPRVANELGDFMRSNNMSYMSKLNSGELSKCCFHNKVTSKQSRIEQINQFHPLIRFINESINRGESQSFKIVSLSVNKEDINNNLKSGYYSFVVSRWIFRGIRHEELLQSRIASISNDLAVHSLSESM